MAVSNLKMSVRLCWAVTKVECSVYSCVLRYAAKLKSFVVNRKKRQSQFG